MRFTTSHPPRTTFDNGPAQSTRRTSQRSRLLWLAPAFALLIACQEEPQPTASSESTPGVVPITAALEPSAAPSDVESLRAALQRAIDEDRILAPLDDNAVTAIRQLIAINGNDLRTQTTLLEIYPLAVQAISGSLSRAELDLAAAQIELLRSTGHQSSSLQMLEDQLAEQRAVSRAEAARPAVVAEAASAGAATAEPADRTPPPIQASAREQAPPGAQAPAAASVAAPTPSRPAPPSTGTATTVAPAPPPAPASAPTPAPDLETPPVQIAFAEARYPPRARARRIEGEVELAFTINTLGELDDIEVIRAEPPDIFETEAIRAAQRWRFEPRRVNGVPVDTRMNRTMRFQMGGG